MKQKALKGQSLIEELGMSHTTFIVSLIICLIIAILFGYVGGKQEISTHNYKQIFKLEKIYTNLTPTIKIAMQDGVITIAEKNKILNHYISIDKKYAKTQLTKGK